MTDKPAVALGILDRVLSYMDRPWKVVVILVFALSGAFGVVLWQERARIADRILHEPITRPELALAAFAARAEQLLRETHGDLAVLTEVHLEDNVVIDRIGIDREGHRWIPIEGPQPALDPKSDMTRVIRFLRNEVVCISTADSAAEDAEALKAAGYSRVCMVAVPPVLGISVGGLQVAWKTPLSPPAEERAGLAMSAAAMKFATW